MNKRMYGLAISVLSGFLLLGTGTAHATGAEEPAVKAANAHFYEALNALFTSDVEPMRQVWSHADDVTVLGPAGGFQVGWEQVGSYWNEQAALKQAALKLGGEIKAVDLHVMVGQDLAIAQNYEQGENVGPDGETVPVKIRATNVFRKENGEWKMVSHQTDLLPFLEKQQQ